MNVGETEAGTLPKELPAAGSSAPSGEWEDAHAPVQIAIAVVHQDRQYLIGQRPAGVPLPGYW
jgi:hypothetical protein